MFVETPLLNNQYYGRGGGGGGGYITAVVPIRNKQVLYVHLYKFR
jgi:hypothetical protein